MQTTSFRRGYDSYEDAPYMEREKQEQICQQLRMLAEGRHPLTGEELPLTGAFADAAVLRTLTQASHCLRDLLEQERPAPAPRPKRERRGKFRITPYQLSGILPLFQQLRNRWERTVADFLPLPLRKGWRKATSP